MKSPCQTIIKIVIGTSFLIGLLFGLAKSEKARAAINPLLNFTGKVTNTDGTEVADGVYNFSFELYTAPTGDSAIWSEDLTAATRFSGIISNVSIGTASTTYTYSAGSATSTLRLGQYLTNASTSESVLIINYDTGVNMVTVASGSPTWSNGQPINNRPNVEGGVININLGSVTDLFGVNFNQPLYLEVTFNSETMQPRKLLTAVPQAFESAKLGGKTEDEFAALAEDETITGEWSFNNIVSVTASSTKAALTVTQDGSGSIVEFKHGTTTALAVLVDGRIQFGDYIFPASRAGSSAGYVLKTDAAGSLYWAIDIAGIGLNGTWATSSNNLYIYPADTNHIVVIGHNATSALGYKFEVEGASLFDNISISSQQEVRFYDAASQYYAALKATTSMGSNVVWSLPKADGSLGEALLTDSAGNLYWGAPASTAHNILSVAHSDVTPTSTLIRGDLLVADSSDKWSRLALGTTGYILYSDGTDAVWNNYGSLWAAQMAATTTDALAEGAINKYYSTLLFAADLAATTTDALSQGTTNLYWSDALFDARLLATTSISTLTSLPNLTQIGTIATGIWQADVITVAYGGTGTTTFAANSLVYASGLNTISQILPGTDGQTLVMSGGTPVWAASTTGAAHDILSVAHLRTEATSTLERGDLLVVKDFTGQNKWSRLALGTNGYILYSDGTDIGWATTTNITALGTITTGTWHGDVVEVAYGGTGATTATGARANLDLDEIYKFAVNSTGTVNWLWQSDGDGRGHWVATSALGFGGSSNGVSKLIGTTTSTFNGAFATSTLIGYEAANDICASEFSDSHFCRTYDILVTVEQDNIDNWTGSAWIAEGPPGYTSNSNDCKGWTSSSSIMLGAFWALDSDGGGMGWLTNCSGEKPIACCKRQ